MVFSDYGESIFAVDGISVSPYTGALTILNFNPTDEGLYVCRVTGGRTLFELKSAGEFFVLSLHHAHKKNWQRDTCVTSAYRIKCPTQRMIDSSDGQ